MFLIQLDSPPHERSKPSLSHMLTFVCGINNREWRVCMNKCCCHIQQESYTSAIQTFSSDRQLSTFLRRKSVAVTYILLPLWKKEFQNLMSISYRPLKNWFELTLFELFFSLPVRRVISRNVKGEISFSVWYFLSWHPLCSSLLLLLHLYSRLHTRNEIMCIPIQNVQSAVQKANM